MGNPAILCTILILGLLISVSEFLRTKKLFHVDFIRAISITFFIIFVLVPLTLQILGPYKSSRFFWLNTINYTDGSLAIPAILIATTGYFSILGGAISGNRVGMVRKTANKFARAISGFKNQFWLFLALIFGSISILSLLIYVSRRGGSIWLLLQYPGQVRVGSLPPGVVESSFTFLTYSMVGIFSAFTLMGLPKKHWLIKLLTLIFVTESAVLLWLRAGRLHLANFVIVLVLAIFANRSRLLRVIGLISGLGIYGLIFYYGKYLTKVTFMLDVPSDPISFIQLFASELAFPYLSLIKSIEMGGQWRCFLDVLLAILYVFVNPFIVVFSGSPLDLGPSAAKINTENILGTTLLGEIPVDIVTYGYLNAAPIGVVITCFLFGIAISWFENAMPAQTTGVPKVLRWAFMIFLSTVGVAYADPVNVVRDGLYLIIPFLTIFILIWLKPNQPVVKATRKARVKSW